MASVRVTASNEKSVSSKKYFFFISASPDLGNGRQCFNPPSLTISTLEQMMMDASDKIFSIVS
jgi:hypothetical protein